MEEKLTIEVLTNLTKTVSILAETVNDLKGTVNALSEMIYMTGKEQEGLEPSRQNSELDIVQLKKDVEGLKRDMTEVKLDIKYVKHDAKNIQEDCKIYRTLLKQIDEQNEYFNDRVFALERKILLKALS